MTPAARLQAAIEILDQVLDGAAAEQVLTGWGRKNRYAGSKDRAAVRDHVFQALRCIRSHAALGGAHTGRGLILGALRDSGNDPEAFFTGQGHAPAPLTEEERAAPAGFSSAAEENDIPDWLWPQFSQDLGGEAVPAAQALRSRAPVHVRANLARTTRKDAQTLLAQDGVTSEDHPAAQSALTILDGARRVKNSRAYTSGLVELQDAASQAIAEALPLTDGQKVLDYCAGGGGKSLSMAARAKLDLYAHDADPKRMKDIAPRAARAGVDITEVASKKLDSLGPFDLVLCDAPCSGSGSWRRAPEGKWRLTEAGLAETIALQARILDAASELVASDGVLAYATCSMLNSENGAQIRAFLERTSGWSIRQEQAWYAHQGTDGFYLCVLERT